MGSAVAPWARCSGLQPNESLEALEKGELQQRRSGKERGVVSSVCGKLEQGELVCRPEGRVWRGADPQAHPRSAIDCSAFPINYSLIMENRQHWLHGSGSSSHVAVAARGTGRPCPYPACLVAVAPTWGTVTASACLCAGPGSSAKT